jgi:hypothetical protein
VKRYWMILLAVTLGLSPAGQGAAWAAGGRPGGGYRHSPGGGYRHSPGWANRYTARAQLAARSRVFVRGVGRWGLARGYGHFSSRRWFAAYGCSVFYNPYDSLWYYYAPCRGCYLPLSLINQCPPNPCPPNPPAPEPPNPTPPDPTPPDPTPPDPTPPNPSGGDGP